MSRRQAAPKPEELIKNLDDKVASIKEEIENIIEELKNDVTAKGSEIEENKKIHEEGLAELNQSLEKLKEEFKDDGYWSRLYECTNFLFSVKATREESDQQTKELKEEVIARLEKTREDIALVEGKTVTSIGEVYENIHTTEEKHTASIADLSQSLEVRGFKTEKKWF